MVARRSEKREASAVDKCLKLNLNDPSWEKEGREDVLLYREGEKRRNEGFVWEIA